MRCLIVVIICAALGCDSGGDPTDAGDARSRPDIGPADCPLNSGWPCTCYGSAPCDDGSRCFSSASGMGICAAECIAGQPPGSACPPEDFAAHPHCQLVAEGTQPTHCLLSCAHFTACPSDQECRNISSTTGLGQCLP
jgi:hypothetical protein